MRQTRVGAAGIGVAFICRTGYDGRAWSIPRWFLRPNGSYGFVWPYFSGYGLLYAEKLRAAKSLAEFEDGIGFIRAGQEILWTADRWICAG